MISMDIKKRGGSVIIRGCTRRRPDRLRTLEAYDRVARDFAVLGMEHHKQSIDIHLI